MRDTSADAEWVRLGVRQLALAGLRARHPECTERDLLGRLSAQIASEEQ